MTRLKSDTIKGSENAKAVANDIINYVRERKKVNLGEILKNRGYSRSVQLAPTKVTRTKSFLQAVKPMLPQFEAERQRFVSALNKKNLSKEKTAVLLSGLDILTKNIQLLSGKSTENVAIKVEISERLAGKYAPQPETTAQHNPEPVKQEAKTETSTAPQSDTNATQSHSK